MQDMTEPGVGDNVSVSARYVCAGANRHTAVADWSSDGIVAFGTDSNIALWQPKVSEDGGGGICPQAKKRIFRRN
jgi:hypothetical protein